MNTVSVQTIYSNEWCNIKKTWGLVYNLPLDHGRVHQRTGYVQASSAEKQMESNSWMKKTGKFYCEEHAFNNNQDMQTNMDDIDVVYPVVITHLDIQGKYIPCCFSRYHCFPFLARQRGHIMSHPNLFPDLNTFSRAFIAYPLARVCRAWIKDYDWEKAGLVLGSRWLMVT